MLFIQTKGTAMQRTIQLDASKLLGFKLVPLAGFVQIGAKIGKAPPTVLGAKIGKAPPP